MWRGTGEGSYPTIDDFSYQEEVTFGHVGKPFIGYGQATRHPETDFPLHAEHGYWRPVDLSGPTGVVEVVMVHPTGLLESLSGTFAPTEGGGTFELSCPAVLTTATAVEVTATTRRFTFEGDTLTYEVAMAAVGQPMTHHLAATLTRVETLIGHLQGLTGPPARSYPGGVVRSRTSPVFTRRYDGGNGRADALGGREPDELVVEEPMTIRLDDHLVSSTMRTPGHDFELAAGFLLAEGLIEPGWVSGIRYCATGPAVESEFNVVSVETDGRAPVPTPRLGSISASCGICGVEAIETLTERLRVLPPYEPWDQDLLVSLPERLRSAQPLFDATGAVHAAALVGRGRRGGGRPRGHRPPQRGRQGHRSTAARRATSPPPIWPSSSAVGRRSRWCRRPGPGATPPSSPSRPRRRWPSRPPAGPA